jgi:hypothetical protein
MCIIYIYTYTHTHIRSHSQAHTAHTHALETRKNTRGCRSGVWNKPVFAFSSRLLSRTRVARGNDLSYEPIPLVSSKLKQHSELKQQKIGARAADRLGPQIHEENGVPSEPRSSPTENAVCERVRVETLMRFKLEVRTLTGAFIAYIIQNNDTISKESVFNAA